MDRSADSDYMRLREKARQAIVAGLLPSVPTNRFWGGNGSGLPCTVCGLPIENGHAQINLTSRADSGGPRFVSGY